MEASPTHSRGSLAAEYDPQSTKLASSADRGLLEARALPEGRLLLNGTRVESDKAAAVLPSSVSSGACTSTIVPASWPLLPPAVCTLSFPRLQ